MRVLSTVQMTKTNAVPDLLRAGLTVTTIFRKLGDIKIGSVKCQEKAKTRYLPTAIFQRKAFGGSRMHN